MTSSSKYAARITYIYVYSIVSTKLLLPLYYLQACGYSNDTLVVFTDHDVVFQVCGAENSYIYIYKYIVLYLPRSYYRFTTCKRASTATTHSSFSQTMMSSSRYAERRTVIYLYIYIYIYICIYIYIYSSILTKVVLPLYYLQACEYSNDILVVFTDHDGVFQVCRKDCMGVSVYIDR